MFWLQYSFFDISLVLFVAHALVEFYVRDFGITAESASRITMLLGSFSLAMAASSLIYLNNYFNSVIVIEVRWRAHHSRIDILIISSNVS